MSVLKRALPFILTLLVGVVVGSGVKRAGHVAATDGTPQSCGMRQRQLTLMPPPPAFESEVLTAKDVTRKAVISYKPEPHYTYDARRHNVTGTVRLRLVLAADGAVREIVPLTTLPDGLTEQAVEAARDIEFTPAVKDGRAVSQYATVEYNFNIY
ncbi:MAG TPA: energy transducer TonB [Pyrinomonadaceae bacterium]|nr:energy transducer TonB [Pyrinomonadaceae bacterium]